MTTKIFSHVLAVAGIARCLSPTQATAQTVTTTAATVVPSGQEWATVSMQDPIDMNQWIDLSWWAYSVDTVHAWAYSTDGRRQQFLGVASFGDTRSDVGAADGKQFENSAYNLFAAGLKPGTYDLVVYPHRIESNAFDGAQVVRITVR